MPARASAPSGRAARRAASRPPSGAAAPGLRPSFRARVAFAALPLLFAACAADGDAVDPAPPAPVAPGAALLPAPRPAAARLAPAAPFRPASADERTAPASAGPRGEIVRVGPRAVTTADLGDFVLRFHPDVAGPAVETLVRIRLVEGESAREGVSLPAAAVDPAADRALDERLRRLRLDYGAGSDPESVLLRTTGRTVAALREDLRSAVRTEMLRARLARLDVLRRDGIDLRVLVAADERTAAAVAAQWRDGADAGLLAGRAGLAPPAAPPVLEPSEVPDAALRERLAAAAPGAVLDPVPFDADDPDRPGATRRAWQVFKVVRTWKGTSAPWAELEAQVESWLREAPPTGDELAAWERRTLRRVGVSRAER